MVSRNELTGDEIYILSTRPEVYLIRASDGQAFRVGMAKLEPVEIAGGLRVAASEWYNQYLMKTAKN